MATAASAATTGSCNNDDDMSIFNTLPAEIWHNIAWQLDNKADLCNLRLTNRELSSRVFVAFKNRCFETVKHVISTHSLTDLAAIAAHPVFGPAVRNIIICTDAVTAKNRVPVNEHIAALATDQAQLLKGDLNPVTALLAPIFRSLALYGRPLGLGIAQDFDGHGSRNAAMCLPRQTRASNLEFPVLKLLYDTALAEGCTVKGLNLMACSPVVLGAMMPALQNMLRGGDAASLRTPAAGGPILDLDLEISEYLGRCSVRYTHVQSPSARSTSVSRPLLTRRTRHLTLATGSLNAAADSLSNTLLTTAALHALTLSKQRLSYDRLFSILSTQASTLEKLELRSLALYATGGACSWRDVLSFVRDELRLGVFEVSGRVGGKGVRRVGEGFPGLVPLLGRGPVGLGEWEGDAFCFRFEGVVAVREGLTRLMASCGDLG